MSKAYVFHGNASGLSLTPNWTAGDGIENSYFGYSSSTAGDVNNDGFSDVIVGALGFHANHSETKKMMLLK